VGGPLRRDPYLAAFVACSFAAAVVVATATGADFLPLYLATMAVVVAAMAWLTTRVTLSRAVLWGLAVWLLAHFLGGLWVLDGEILYAHWIAEPVVRYDNLVHAWGFGFAGLATLQAMGGAIDRSARAVVFVAVVSAAMGWGALNEIVEWIATKLAEDTNVGGYENLARDLVANAVGGSVAGAWAVRRG
jgi:hypothetical protein